MELFGAVDRLHVPRHFAFTTFESRINSFFMFFLVAFVVCGLNSLSRERGGGGSNMASFFMPEDVGALSAIRGFRGFNIRSFGE